MIAALLALLAMLVVGLPVALAVDRNARGLFLLGVAYLYGSGAVFLVLLALAIVHIPWTPITVTVPLLAIAVIAFAYAYVKTHPSPRGRGWPLSERSESKGPGEGRPSAHWLIDAITIVTLIGYVLYCTLAPLWEWDFWAIWGLKARVFFDAGTIDWHFLESTWNRFAHPDYPLLVTLNFDFVAVLNGAWSDRWLGLLFAGWGAATLLIVRDLARRESTAVIASSITLAVAAIALSRYVGMAEGPLVAYGGCGVLLLRRALLFDDDAALRHAALLLGFAASCKNEGVAMLVAVAITLAFIAPRKIIPLWPAVLIAAPWMLLRAVHQLPTDLATGSVLERLMDHLTHFGTIASVMNLDLVDPFGWVLILLALALVPAAARRREAFVLVVTIIQLGFYFLSYLVTPADVSWHIVTSWPRLTRQLSIPITYAVMLMLANFALRGEDARHAEARPDL